MEYISRYMFFLLITEYVILWLLFFFITTITIIVIVRSLRENVVRSLRENVLVVWLLWGIVRGWILIILEKIVSENIVVVCNIIVVVRTHFKVYYFFNFLFINLFIDGALFRNLFVFSKMNIISMNLWGNKNKLL